jgi:hypothetical protein
MCLPLPDLFDSSIKPSQVRLTQRNSALQREERKKGLVIGLRSPHLVLQFLNSPFTHPEFLCDLFPALFKQPDGGII